jgi:hypothetical protein
MLGPVEPELLEEGLGALEELKRVKVEALPGVGVEAAVYLRHFYALEVEIARRLFDLASHPGADLRGKVEKLLPTLDPRPSFSFLPSNARPQSTPAPTRCSSSPAVRAPARPPSPVWWWRPLTSWP